MADESHEAIWERLDRHAGEIAQLARELAKHLGECGMRHADIIRRQDEGSRERQQLRVDMTNGLTSLASKHDQAHRDNQATAQALAVKLDQAHRDNQATMTALTNRIGTTERSMPERLLKIAGAILLVLLGAAVTYLVKH